jgi:hypothetical protein
MMTKMEFEQRINSMGHHLSMDGVSHSTVRQITPVLDVLSHAQSCKKFDGMIVSSYDVAQQYHYRHVVSCRCGMKWYLDDQQTQAKLWGQPILELVAYINANYRSIPEPDCVVYSHNPIEDIEV